MTSAGIELFTEPGNDDIIDFVWSPDSSTILFVREVGQNSDIWSIASTGAGATQLTTSPARDESPRWSPDGTTIVFVSGRDGNDELYVMNRNGSNQINLTNDPSNDRAPDWGACPPR
jgi:TolB protein